MARALRTLVDRRWTEPLPIYAWLIEHPEGLILVDTGETARSAVRGYFPRWHPYYRFGVRFRVRPEDEIGAQLSTLGVRPADVRWVVLTHLHTDHAGGLHHFPDSEILVSREEYEQARGVPGRLRGYLPHRWPTWFAPRLLEFGDDPVGPFPTSCSVTAAGDVRVVPTPGHTRGHCSVVVLDGAPKVVFLAGDATYSQALLERRAVDGLGALGAGRAVARRSVDRILALARMTEMVYLPSHDPGAGLRLRNAYRLPNEQDRADAQTRTSAPRAIPREDWVHTGGVLTRPHPC
jgi:glyoxylase-like metal-dependent hydrolase (beta-lactamase superfamily II)